MKGKLSYFSKERGLGTVELQPSSYFLLIVATLSSGIGGVILCMRKSWSEEALNAMISAGAGLLLSITILDLFPHSISDDGHSLMPFVLLGFALLFVMEMISQKSAWLGGGNLIGAYAGFFTHSFVEGLSLMVSFQLDTQLGVSLLLAMIFHKIPDGITVASLILASTKNRMMALLGSIGLGLATLLGMLSLKIGDLWIPFNWSHVVIAMTTGVFLYVSASHLVPFIQRTKRLQMGVYFFAAALAYMLISILFHGYTSTHA